MQAPWCRGIIAAAPHHRNRTVNDAAPEDDTTDQMSLLGDFDEIKRSWKALPGWLKVVISASFLVSVLSIGSLADSVFQLKGFFAEAVAFYRMLFGPLASVLATYLQVEDPQAAIDLAVSINLLAVAETNALITVRPLGRWSEIYSKPGFRVRVLLFNWIFTCILAAIAWWLMGITATVILFVIVFPATYILRSVFILYVIGRKSGHQYQQELVAGGYMVSVYLLIGFIAAVSEGLTRPLN